MNDFVGKTSTVDNNRHANWLAELHSILLEVDRLKTVRRQNPISSGKRAETTAEHSWHLGVAVMLFARFAVEDLDINRAVTLAVVHDIPEVFVGDTFVYSAAVETRHERENTAMTAFLDRHEHLAEVATIFSQWGDYESCRSPEGRFVMALDVLLPVFLNHANLAHSSWIRHGVTGGQVRSRIEKVRASCPDLAELALRLVDDAVAQGVLKSDR